MSCMDMTAFSLAMWVLPVAIAHSPTYDSRQRGLMGENELKLDEVFQEKSNVYTNGVTEFALDQALYLCACSIPS